jgi:putative endonuclease
MASLSRVTYVGVTSDLEKRVFQHKHGTVPGFTSKYQINRLVYLESFGDIRDAIAREKEIKGWRREKKVALIVEKNPTWADIAESWPEAKKEQIPHPEKRVRDDSFLGFWRSRERT